MSNRSPAFTAERLLHTLELLPATDAYLVGFSGGADSTALLHALSTIRNQLNTPVSAVHVNHGLHDDADLWQSQCEVFCRQFQIKLICLRVELKHCSGKGLEAEARHLRYEAISALLKPGVCLLTAHHADDQAETLLLNLMRGSGIDGLSAMPESRPLGDGILQRPLLQFQNKALRDYLVANDIEWIEDPANQYLDHDRNFVRHEIIPLLEKRWPEVSKRLVLTREAMKDARLLLEQLSDNYLRQYLAHPLVLQLTPQITADAALFRLVVRRWVKQSATPSIPVYRLASFYDQVQRTDSDHNVSLHWDGCVMRLYKQQLWLQTDAELSPCPTVDWPPTCSEIDLGENIGQLSLEGETGLQPAGWFSPDGEISVGNRNSFEVSGIMQGSCHKSLKNIFQAADIPPWLRDYIPLCRLDDELVAIGDWCFSDQLAVWLSENKLRLRWCPRDPLLEFVLAQQHPGVSE